MTRLRTLPTIIAMVLLAAALSSGRAAAAPPTEASAALASGSFTVTPPSGPRGTQVHLASVTRCPGPVGPGDVVTIRMVQWPSISDAVPVFQVTFPLAPDGSWSGSFPAQFPESGPVDIEASCGTVATYAEQSFRQTPAGRGYWMATTNEVGLPCFCPEPLPPTNIATFGDARYEGSPAAFSTAIPLVGLAATPVEGLGYWLVDSRGGVYSFGDATFFGSAATLPLSEPIVGMAATPTGRGYWLVASDGGIFGFGDARFFGSTGGTPLQRPVVDMAASPTGNGYRLVAADGGIFAYGDARFLGSTGGTPLQRPVVDMAATSSGQGYWLLAADGGIFAFGDATFHGSYAGWTALRGQPSFFALSATPDTRPG